MSERAGSTAALVAVVVLAGAVAGGAVAMGLRYGGGSRLPADADVVAAIANRADVDRDVAGCVLGRLVVVGALDDGLRRRLVDATDALDDVAALGPAVSDCAPTTTTTVASGPLPACTGAAGADPAALEVCAVDALVGLLRQGSELDVPTASCAAEAVVDDLGVPAVIAALETGLAPPDLRARLQAAFAACG